MNLGLLTWSRIALAAGKLPLFCVVDLNVQESQEVELSNGKRVMLKLLAIEETRDNSR